MVSVKRPSLLVGNLKEEKTETEREKLHRTLFEVLCVLKRWIEILSKNIYKVFLPCNYSCNAKGVHWSMYMFWAGQICLPI